MTKANKFHTTNRPLLVRRSRFRYCLIQYAIETVFLHERISDLMRIVKHIQLLNRHPRT